jgi:hypothetical protein
MERFRRVVSYDGLSARIYDSLDAWMASHQDILEYISFQTPDSPTSSADPFSVRRQRVHERTVGDLGKFQASLNRLGESLQRQISDFPSQLPPLKCHFLDTTARKFLFLKARVLKTHEHVVSKKVFALMTRLNAVRSLISLMESVLIPDDVYCCVSSSFLTMNFNVDEKKLKIRRMLARLNSWPSPKAPVWVSNFDGFFADVIRRCESSLPDNQSVYVRTLDTDLSVPIAHHFARELRDIGGQGAVELPGTILKFCKTIIPVGFSKRLQSLALLVTFRVVYELLECDQRVAKGYDFSQKVIELQKLPATEFSLPLFIARPGAEALTVREFFKRDPMHRGAADALTEAQWATNPFDVLFEIDAALTVIGKNARNKALAQERAVGQCVAFDDMFTVFLGVFLASDLQDVGRLFEGANAMLAGFPLSARFRYALETLEALVNYLERVTVRDGKIWVERRDTDP